MEQVTEIMEQMLLQKQNQNHSNTATCCDKSENADFTIQTIVKPIHPDKPMKEGDCPICRGDQIVKVMLDGEEHYDTCICCKDKVAIQKILKSVERIRKMQKEQQKEKEKAESNKKPQEIKWEAFHPDSPIKEGECPICRGVGVLRAIIDGYEYSKNCICVEKQIAISRLKKAGIAESIEKYTFDSFQTPEEWQKRLKQKAIQFLDEKEKWFFVGGQVGCGKTHICTAILKEFMEKGKDIKYILWANEIVKLKASKMDDESYQKLINPLLTAEVLYIDDFFKTEKGKKPSEADIRTAFEIINYRYINANLITIISTEKTVDDLIEIDEAVGSRIHQKSKGYRNVILPEKNRNWRLRREKCE